MAWTDFLTIGVAVALAGLAAWVAVLQVRFSRLRRHYRQLLTGVEGADLEQLLDGHMVEVRRALETVSELDARTRGMERTLHHTMQWMGIVRYNPFRHTGGDQSFAWAIVDGDGNGVVLSSLHARENTRVYAKPLLNWESPYSLTDEEKQAIARAREQQG